MTITEAIEYINAHTWSQWKLGLSRTEELLRLLGNPQKQLRFVHVAGSNGKGSTCAMVERILREAGYVTGFYPSPYIEDFRERIQVCGEYITEEALCRITARVRDAADSMEDHPSQFEIITAIGLLYFAEKNCNIVVLEVGLGGIFDSTNVIDAPEVAVITNIGLEHTEYLGNTLAEIAGNKCGIIKSGADVVCYENAAEVMDVVRRVCEEKGCPLHIARYSRILLIEKGLEGQTFRFLHDPAPASQDIAISADEPLRLGLLGEYQLHNAATALTIVEALRGRGWKIPQEAVCQGLAEVRWPARFEVLSRHPLFILDGGHNPQCAEALAESLREYLPDCNSNMAESLREYLPDCNSDLAESLREYLPDCNSNMAESLREYLPDSNSDLTDRESDLPGRKADLGKKAVFLMGMLADKDYRAVIDIISPFAAGFVCLTPDSPRALPAEKLAAELQERGFYAKPCGTAAEGIKEALSLAVRLGGRGCGTEDTSEKGALPVVSFGSLYMAGAVRSAFRSFAGL